MMKKNIKTIMKLTLESGLFTDPIISFFAEGYGNYNYLIEEKGRKFVLRIKKSKEVQFVDSLEKEFIFLKYFNQKGIDFVPEALYFSKKNNFQIQTFLEGKKVSQKDFTNQQIELFAKQLYELFSLSVDDFFKFCHSKKYPEPSLYNPVKSLEIYGFNRFNEVKKGAVDIEVIRWISEKLKENYNFLKENAKVQRYGFNWGDVQSKLIVSKEGNMFFYDFEHAMISMEPGLSCIKIHGKFDDSQFANLIQSYAKFSGENKRDILEKININEKMIRISDVVWAVMKWSQSMNKEDREKFKELSYKRIKLAGK